MTQMGKKFIVLGAINAFLAVALGAFGAHGLKHYLSEQMLTIYQTGVHYHMNHALALLLVGTLAHWHPRARYLAWSGSLLFIGIVLFSGSLYVLTLTGIRGLGAITPIGGTAFLAGWLILAIGFLRQR